MTESMKRCRQCGEVKPLTEFVRNAHGRGLDASNPNGYRGRCSICEITNRTEPKTDRRERHKCRDTRVRHGKRLGIPVDKLDHFYGWDLDRMETDVLTIKAGGVCPKDVNGCGEPLLNLPDIHLDIIDPTEQPFYGVNTRWVCATCNGRKGPKSLMRQRIEEAERLAIAHRNFIPGQLHLF